MCDYVVVLVRCMVMSLLYYSVYLYLNDSDDQSISTINKINDHQYTVKLEL